VAVNWMDAAAHARANAAQSYQRQRAGRGVDVRQPARRQPQHNGRGINAGKNYGGPG
jgi:hypothetical protein